MRGRRVFSSWTPTLLAILLHQFPVHSALFGRQHDFVERGVGDYGVEDTTTEDDYFHFVTRPDIRALKWNITVYDNTALAPGYWFIAPYALLGQKERGEEWIGPYIYDDNGELIWSGAQMFDNFNIFDFRPVELGGKHFFTAIYKREDAGVIVDNSYRIKDMVQWPGGHDAANMHEFTLFDGGSRALMLTLEDRHESNDYLRGRGYDKDCFIHADGLIELDLTSSPPKKLFTWSLLDHISLEETTYPAELNIQRQCSDGWDAHHCNALDHFPNGDYLLSCRHTDTLYRISRETGSIVWRLGGTKSDFEFARGAKFSRQHHGRVLEANETHTVISLFDNARAEGLNTATHEFTRGLILSLHDRRAEIVLEIPHPEREWSTSRGSLEILPNGNVLVGWTFHSRISEHGSDGKLLMYAKLPPKKNTYRTYKSTWIGRPVTPPDVWAHAVGGNTDVYVSWNGATDIGKWNLYRSDSKGGNQKLLTSVPKSGFETFARLDGWVRYIVAEAVDNKGRPLGQSRAIETIPPDRDGAKFVEEQDWLKEHFPPGDKASGHGWQGAPSGFPTIAPPPHHSDEEGSTTWNRPSLLHNRSAVLAYVSGFATCSIAVLLWWMRDCVRRKIRRKSALRKYTRLSEDDPEDEYELDQASSLVDGDVNGLLASRTSKHE